MGRTLALRKCEEHEDCQLQSLNGGEWDHTPSRRPVGERLRLDAAEQHALEAQVSEILGQSRALGVALRNQHERADILIGIAEDRGRDLERLEVQVGEALARAQEMLLHLNERTDRVDASAIRLDDYVTKLNQVQSLYTAVADLGARLDGEIAGIRSDLHGLDHHLSKEREERLADSRKVQRQFRTVMERFDA